MKELLNFNAIRRAYDKLGYRFFEHGNFNLNIGGVRSLNSKSNQFDDYIFVAYFKARKPFLMLMPATTDPGKYWLQNPLNKDGTAILVPDQYIGAYELGFHGYSSSLGPYVALEQVKPMAYVRDNNKDSILDFDLYRNSQLREKNIFWDNIKSNIHRASQWKIIQLVERYSAACQVVQSPKEYEEFMRLCEKAANEWGNSFTYTLFEETDFK